MTVAVTVGASMRLWRRRRGGDVVVVVAVEVWGGWLGLVLVNKWMLKFSLQLVNWGTYFCHDFSACRGDHRSHGKILSYRHRGTVFLNRRCVIRFRIQGRKNRARCSFCNYCIASSPVIILADFDGWIAIGVAIVTVGSAIDSTDSTPPSPAVLAACGAAR